MNRFVYFLSIVAVSATSIAIGCGGSDLPEEFNPTDKDATVSDSTNSPNDSIAPSEDGGTPDTSKGPDAPTSTGSNPGKVTCGSAECGSGTSCCLRFFLDGGSQQSCESSCSGAGTFTFTCDEKADCTGGDRCCLELTGATCDNNCPGTAKAEIVLCKTNAECSDAGPCNPKKCANRTYDVCGSPTTCN